MVLEKRTYSSYSSSGAKMITQSCRFKRETMLLSKPATEQHFYHSITSITHDIFQCRLGTNFLFENFSLPFQSLRIHLNSLLGSVTVTVTIINSKLFFSSLRISHACLKNMLHISQLNIILWIRKFTTFFGYSSRRIINLQNVENQQNHHVIQHV